MTDLGEPLTERERDVLTCLAQGASNKEIAHKLTISPNTVKVHVRNIYTKLGATSRTDALRVAWQQGILLPPGIEEASAGDVPLAQPVSVEVAQSETLTSELTEMVSSGSEVVAPPLSGDEAIPAGRRLLSYAAGAFLLLIIVIALGLLLRGSGIFGSSANEEATEATITPVPFTETPIAGSDWAIGQSMPGARAAMASAGVGVDLYHIGGETVAGIVNDVAIYALDERRWLQGAPKLTAVADAGAATLSGEVYVVGGRLPGGQPSSVVEAYSPLNNGWRPVAPLPQATFGGLVLTDGHGIYYFGGVTTAGVTADSYRFDPAGQEWHSLPPMAQPRAHAAGGFVTGQFYVVGGTDGAADSAACERFDPLTESWSPCPPMQEPRAGAGSAVLLNNLYIFGGQVGEGSRFSETFDPNTGMWTRVETPMFEGASEWADMGVGNVETRIYVFGGRDGDTLLADTYVLTPFTYQFFIPAAPSGNQPEP